MKNIKLYIILLLVLFPNVIYAKSVNGITCNYTIKCKSGYDSASYEITDLKIKLSEYNDWNNGEGFSKKTATPGLSIFIKKSGSTSFQSVLSDEKITDYYYKDSIYYGWPLKIFEADVNGSNFANYYHSNNGCPQLYCNTSNNKYLIETVDYNNGIYNSETLNSTSEFLRETSSSQWQSKSGFYANTTYKEPKTCSYSDVAIDGNYYGGGANYDTANISFITNYDQNGNEISYDISFNGKTLLVPLTDLNNDIREEVGSDIMIEMSSSQLKSVFDSSCRKTVYVYLSEVFASVYTYTITTSEEEAKSNVINQGFEGSAPSESADTDKIDYNNICGNESILGAVQIIGWIITVTKILVPIIIVVVGMIDFGKAVISNDEKALSNATASLIRRFVSGIVIFFIPTLVFVLFNMANISDESDSSGNFVQCTKCMLKPGSECDNNE